VGWSEKAGLLHGNFLVKPSIIFDLVQSDLPNEFIHTIHGQVLISGRYAEMNNDLNVPVNNELPGRCRFTLPSVRVCTLLAANRCIIV